ARLVHGAAERARPFAGRTSVARAPARLRALGVRAPTRAGARGRAAVGGRAWGGGARDGVGVPRRRAARRARGRGPGAGLSRRAAKGCAVNDDGPSVLTMIGAVALIVALVILVFFAAGYGFGRLFL